MSEVSRNSPRPRRGGRTPWARKRIRLLLVLGALFLLAVPPLSWRLSLAGEVRTALAEIRAEGRPASLEDLHAGRAPLTPEENGATVYREAANAFRDVPEAYSEYLPFRGAVKLPPGEPFSPERKAAMEALVSANGPALALLKEAAGIPACRYIEIYEPRENRRDLRHVAASDSLSTLLCSAAVLRAEAGDLQGAWEALSVALALARWLEDDGLYTSLLSQWQIEARILEAIERIAGVGDLPGGLLEAFQAQFSTAHRIASWRRMCDVEQALFLARVGSGRNRSVVRSLIIAGGVGDLNLRAYLRLMADFRAGFGLPLAAQQPLIERVRALEARVGRRPLLYVTLLFHRPFMFQGSWGYMRAQWDEAVIAKTALAVLDFRRATGDSPEQLADLVPDWLATVPETLSDDSPLGYRREGDGFRMWRVLKDGEMQDCWVVAGLPDGP